MFAGPPNKKKPSKPQVSGDTAAPPAKKSTAAKPAPPKVKKTKEFTFLLADETHLVYLYRYLKPAPSK